MSLKRWAAKRDANERPIIDALEARGFVVEQFDTVDLVVGHKERPDWLRLLEVKGKHGKLTPRQVEFRKKFRVYVVRTVAEALAVVL